MQTATTNYVSLSGRLVNAPEVTLDGVRLLIAVNSFEPRRRVDVLPVLVKDMDAAALAQGQEVTCEGSLQRRFIDSDSQLEVVATSIQLG